MTANERNTIPYPNFCLLIKPQPQGHSPPRIDAFNLHTPALNSILLGPPDVLSNPLGAGSPQTLNFESRNLKFCACDCVPQYAQALPGMTQTSCPLPAQVGHLTPVICDFVNIQDCEMRRRKSSLTGAYFTLGLGAGGKALWECVSRPLSDPLTPSSFELQAMIEFAEWSLKPAGLLIWRRYSEDFLNFENEENERVELRVDTA
ncbi:uncharacterized protein PAC_13431 [Phialocephala subalpina]|uniref:Uncharacterized protein n=1 Tax=Phialocephala subalpina TaxID=576137 RepID=A0A1L7XET0_9HELO|nr:uncharacterized protein PAC_13431 [Phialocephala subalpina]